MEDRQTLKISLDEVEQARPLPRPTLRSRTTNFANAEPLPTATFEAEKGNVFFQAWFYLGAAGLAGSLLAWAIAEPGFIDGGVEKWGNVWLMPMVVGLMCVGLAVAESLIERSQTKAMQRAALSLVLGTLLGFVLDRLSDVVYNFGLGLCGPDAVAAISLRVWLVRGAAWAIYGIAGGVVYGIVGRSVRKAAYGSLGGALGAALGGVIFDPITFVTHGGAPSRAIGLSLLGFATGSAMGLVESALKDRWLYVTGGPLAGKQFILYKPVTTIGSNQSCDIYLFKDPDIAAVHAVLQVKHSCLYLKANGPVNLSGLPVLRDHILENGADVQLGRYHFRYQEKER